MRVERSYRHFRKLGSKSGGRRRRVTRTRGRGSPRNVPARASSPGGTAAARRAGRPGPGLPPRRPRSRSGTAVPSSRAGKVLQHKVCGVHPARRAAHADPDPQVVLGGEGLGDVPQPVVAAFAAAELQLHRIEGNVDLVVDGDDVAGIDVVELGQRRDRAAGDVHVAQRLGQHHPRAADAEAAFQDLGPGLVRLEAAPDPGGEFVEDHLADVVPVVGVLGSGVAEAYDQPGVSHGSVLR